MGEQKTALVLSAGGMFGAYQAGAYKAVLRHVRPDLVVGASVGALNGWLIASGCTPDHLIERWLDPASGAALRLYPNAGWRKGWFDPEPLRRQTEQLVSSCQPQIPFGLVMVRVPRLKTVLVTCPDISAAHLQATCSIPLFLPAVQIQGARFVDGGFLDKLPVQAAVQMGATRIIAIDCLPDVGSRWLRAGIGTVRLFKPKVRLPRGLRLTVVSPSVFLGTASDAVFWKCANAERWIALGEQDAARVLREKPLFSPVSAHSC